MRRTMQSLRLALLVASYFVLSSCGGGGGGGGGGAAKYTAGGIVSGLIGSLVLQNNGGDNIIVSANGSFTFPTTVLSGSAYDVSVLTQPVGQTCAVTSGSGILTSNISSVAVNCTTVDSTPSLTLFAGNLGGAGNGDGTGVESRFNYPQGTATDGAGNIYVADTFNQTIRKISPAGVVLTLAGSPGIVGSADGTGAAATFNHPTNLATDSAGNVYVTDFHNQTIRKITPVGVVSTFAGSPGVLGSTDGTGVTATLNYPRGIATDSTGNVYVADHGNCTVRKITPAGVVSTLAGAPGVLGSADGSGAIARFNCPVDIATDNTGNAYVTDDFNHTIRKITPAGVVSTFAGSPGVSGSADGTGAAARFFIPRGIATDTAGNVYVNDYGNGTVRKITPAGVVSTLAGAAGVTGYVDGTGAAARFTYLGGIAADTAGNVYVTDLYYSTIRKITRDGFVSTLAGSISDSGSADGTGASARFSNPSGVASDNAGNVYVADTRNSTIRKIAPMGIVSTLAVATNGAASSDTLQGIATDSAGNVYFTDNIFPFQQRAGSTIRKITSAGVVTTLAGSTTGFGSADGTGAAASFYLPLGVAADDAGNVYVADTYNHTVRKITPAGVVSTLAGSPQVAGSSDGIGAAARFNHPIGIATDRTGNIFVADTYNHTIRKITPSGVVSTVAGSAGVTGSADGTGAVARFNYLVGMATDSTGNVYVADELNSTIRKITPHGKVTTVVGVSGVVGFTPGALPGALSSPIGVAISGTSLYITTSNGVAVVRNIP